MTLMSEPGEAAVDPAILASSSLAREALEEITDITSIGSQDGYEAHSETVATLFFKSLLPGYPGWRWAATLVKVSPDDPVTVMEVQLLPGEDALTAPEWIPWSERLAQYRKAQAKQAAEEAAAAEQAAEELRDVDDVDPEDDLLENDHSDYDVDLDGVDIDSLEFDLFDEEADEDY